MTTQSESTEGKEEYARLTLESVGLDGDTCAQYEGETIGVFGGIPGEEVVARIHRYKRRRRRQVSAIVTEVVTPSKHRITPPCPYYGPCSGCQWQHIDYAHQLTLKREAVERHFGDYEELKGLSVEPTLAGPETFGYRNHARFAVRNGGALGFSNRATRRFVQIDSCMLMASAVNDVLQELQGKCGETSALSIRYGVNTGECLVQPTLKNPDILLQSGQSHYHEKVLGRTFRVASPSFFQVNTRQAEQLVEVLASGLDLKGEEVLVDAYAGVGTFAVLLAPRVRRVIAIEESAAAVRDAAVNAEDVENLEFVEGKTEDVIATLDAPPDVVILDPPRVGCHPDVLEALADHRPRRVAYVSCDPGSLARDLHLLVRGGFEVRQVQPVDMFPQTYHVECVVILAYNGIQRGGAAWTRPSGV